jgi:DNA-binding transcriptional regulator YiaG
MNNKLRSFKDNTKLSYPKLAILFGVSASAVQHWYLNVRNVPGSVVILIRLYEDQPALMKKVLPDF